MHYKSLGFVIERNRILRQEDGQEADAHSQWLWHQQVERGGRVHRSEFWSLCYLFSSAFIPKTVLFRFMIFMIRFPSFIYFAHIAWNSFCVGCLVLQTHLRIIAVGSIVA